MVLTRLTSNQARKTGFGENISANMDAQGPITTSAVSTAATGTANTLVTGTAGAAIDPASSSSTSPSPPFSAITTRGDGQLQLGSLGVANVAVNPSAIQPPPQQNFLGDIASLIREEMARQAGILRDTLRQEVAQNVQRAMAEHANSSASVQNMSSAAPELPPDVAASFSPLSGIGRPTQAEPSPQLGPLNNDQWGFGFSNNLPGTHRQASFPPSNHVQPGAYNNNFTQPQAFQQPYRQAFFPQASHGNPDLSKWGLKFNGTSRSVSAEEFISRVGFLCQDYNISMNDIRRSFPSLLEGQALDWYYTWRKLNPDHTFDDLVSAFLAQYRRFENEFQLKIIEFILS